MSITTSRLVFEPRDQGYGCDVCADRAGISIATLRISADVHIGPFVRAIVFYACNPTHAEVIRELLRERGY